MKVRMKKLHPDAVIPSYAKPGDAGMDLIAVSVSESDTQITCDTQLAVEIPDGFVGLIFSRSSIRKYKLSLSNSVGVIDSGYRGSIQVTFNKLPGYTPDQSYKVGDRVCQIVVLPFPPVEPEETDELSDSDRGTGGFGSTGV